MIIRKVIIENYLCYYGVNTFELTEGLNIILGENGEGKTKFFESIEWLFNEDNRDLERLVSAKMLEETEIGSSFIVRISMTVEQFGSNNIITKSFLAKKIRANECSTSSLMTEGIEENSMGERIQVDGRTLLNRVFPFQIRAYSMFKGEAQLNIFENDCALENLIKLFSEARHYDKYSEKAALFRESSEKDVDRSAKRDKENERLYKILEMEIRNLADEKEKYQKYLNTTEDAIRKTEENLRLAESHVENADALETINKRIKNINEKISITNEKVEEDYTTLLFDEKWILIHFEKFHKEFSNKITTHSKKRRELQSDYDKQKGIREGEKKARAELLNNAVPLPVGVPSKSHMEEMLNDEICKVCNREAKKGSEPYLFMMKRLENYLGSQVIDDDEYEKEEPLFKYDYTTRLEYLCAFHEDSIKNIRMIKIKIQDLFEFNESRKIEIEELKEELENEITEREKILGDASIAEERLIDVLRNYNTWQKDLVNCNRDKNEYTTRLKRIDSELKIKKSEKEKIDISSANTFLIRTREILRDIETIFIDTKENKFNEFIDKLQSKSNAFFKTINIDSFTGTIVFHRRNDGTRTIVEVKLFEDNRPFYKPNQSLLTSMHISILFAISELAFETKSENYPMIFDAPTSSFGENKTARFLNLIFETENQKILLIKDFIHTDKSSKTLTIKNEFNNVRRNKAFWVKLERPFDPNNLKTINTQVITL